MSVFDANGNIISMDNNIAPQFSTSAAYAVGAYVIEDSVLYKFKAAHAAGAWNASEVEAAKVGDDLSSLKSALDEITDYLDASYVTADIAGTYAGLSVTKESDNSISFYGTASNTRRICFLNGNKATKTTSGEFVKTLDAGTYYVEILKTGYNTDYYLSYTATTFSSETRLNAGLVTFDAPVMVGLVVIGGENFGTSDNRTNLTIHIKKLSAKDTVARQAIDEIQSDKNILKNLIVNTGYYYDSDGNQVSDANFASVENVPYSVAYAYFAPCKPAMFFMDGDGNKIKYVGGSTSVLNFNLPLVGGAKKMHISFNIVSFPDFYISRSKWFDSRYKYRSCAVYGDSIAKGNYANIGGVVQSVDCAFTKMACEMLGITSYTNHAIGGSGYSTGGTATSNIWEDQIGSGSPTQDEASLIIVSAGTNDWGHDTPLGSLGDSTPETMYGAVYAVLNALRIANPDAMIVATTPLYRGSGTGLAVYSATNGVSKTMGDYIKAIRDVCDMLNVFCLDMNGAELHPTYTPGLFYTDHLHPIQRGHNVMGLWLATKLNELAKITNPAGS